MKFDSVVQNVNILIIDRFKNFVQYNEYLLYMNLSFKQSVFEKLISHSDVRLNDKIAVMIFITLKVKDLHHKYFADSDNAEIIKTTQVLLNHLYKIKKIVEKIDINENVITKKTLYYM